MVIIIVIYVFSVAKKTEDPHMQVLASVEKDKLPSKIDSTEKYKIVNRSTVVPEKITGNKKVVLLTIDDGPSHRTLQIIDVLKKHKAKAIFFINGMNVINNPEVLEQTTKEGFTVGNHTWSHLNLKKEKDINIVEKEINSDSLIIEKLTGNKPVFFRAPYGESTPYVRSYIKDNGMIFMDWSGSALDWDKSAREKDIFINNVTSNLHPGSIILIHEHPWSLENLDALLTKLELDGYTYVDPKNIIE